MDAYHEDTKSEAYPQASLSFGTSNNDLLYPKDHIDHRRHHHTSHNHMDDNAKSLPQEYKDKLEQSYDFYLHNVECSQSFRLFHTSNLHATVQ